MFPFEYPSELESTIDIQICSINEEDAFPIQFEKKMHDRNENGDNYQNFTQYKYTQDQVRESWLQIFGRTKQACSVCIHIQFWQCVVLQIPKEYYSLTNDFFAVKQLILDTLKKDRHNIEIIVSYHHSLFQPQRVSPNSNQLQLLPFLHVWCKSKLIAGKVKKIFRFSDYHSRITRNLPVLNNYIFLILEEDVSPTLRFLEMFKIQAGGFISFEKKNLIKVHDYTHCNVEYKTSIGFEKVDFIKPFDVVDLWPQRIISFDIESPTVCDDSLPDNEITFCNAEKDPCRCICSTVWDTYSNKIITASHTFGKHSTLSHTDEEHYSFCYETEMEMFEGWRDFMIQVDFDWITGWNTNNFDWPYMYKRMQLLNSQSRFFFWSRIICYECVLSEKVFESKQQGVQDKTSIICPGRINFDLLAFWRKTFKCKYYSLKNVCSNELENLSKIELSYGELGRHMRSNNVDRMKVAIEYCVRDAILPIKLFQKKQVLQTMIEMAKVTSIFMNDLHSRGQILPFVALLFLTCKRRNFIMTHTTFKPQGYKGAEVLATTVGYYGEELVVVLDFNSLYPSIMLEHNLCFSTYCPQREENCFQCQTDIGESYFRQDIEGILPDILNRLLAARKQANREKAISTNPNTKAILHSRQLALKIAANSVYGVCGAPANANYCLEILAATVTTCGRKLIISSKQKIEEHQAHLNVKAIAGDTDSVMLLYPNLTSSMEDIKQCFEYAEQAAALISHGFLVFAVEKIYKNAHFFGQKRYAGWFMASPLDKGKLETKGGMDVKRNYPQFFAQLYGECVKGSVCETICTEQQLVDKIATALDKLVNGQVNTKELAYTVKLGKKYSKNGDNLLQVIVRNKIASRGGNVPKAGDTVDYVLLQTPRSCKTVGEKVEDVGYVLQHPEKCKLDYAYYIEKIEDHLLELSELRFKSTNLLLQYLRQLKSTVTLKQRNNHHLGQYYTTEEVVSPTTNRKRVAGTVVTEVKKKPAPKQGRICF